MGSSTAATDETLKNVLDELEDVEKKKNGQWMARCPAHNDNTASLSVAVGDEYPVVLNCFAGCSFKDVADELDSLSTHWKPWEGTEVARYTYWDEDGIPLYDVVRYEMRDEEHPAYGQKRFAQQAYLPDHEDAGKKGCPEGYVWGRKKHGIEPVLYRLPKVKKAAQNGRVVVLVEGEEDVHTAEDMGLVATTNPQGAGKWRTSFTKALEGAPVVILPDNDPPGRKHGRNVGQALLGKAESVRIVDLPGLPEKGDVTDWVEDGGTADELKELVNETPIFEPNGNGQAVDTTNGPNSDTEQGERYITKDGRIIYVKPLKKGGENRSVVADFVAEITREITREDGTRLYRIEGETRQGRSFELDIEASDFEQDRRLKGAIGAAAGAEAAVRAGMSRHISAALKMLSGDVVERRRYGRTGWSPDGFVLPGRMDESVEVELPESLPYKAETGGDLSAGQDALDNLVRSLDPTVTAPTLTFALTGPLVRHVDLLKRHGWFIYGRTGSLKTSFAQAAMCLYGPQFINDEHLLKMGEGMTRNAAMALAGAAHDLPILFDNYKPSTGRGDRDFINLIHNVIEGGEKARLNRNSKLKDRKKIRAWPIITGEDLPDTDPASLARNLAVEFRWNSGQDNPELTRAQEHSRHLATIGSAWIEWLHTDDGQEVAADLEETFPERRKKWTAYLRRTCPDMVNILRVASNLATNTLVYDAAKQCPALRPVLAEHEQAYRDGLGEIAHGMGEVTSESLQARRLIEGLKSLKAAGRVRFTRRLGEDYDDENRVGYVDDDGYYLILDLAIEAVQDLYKRSGGLGGVTRQALCSQLKDIGLVARTGRDRTTRTVRVADGSRRRVLHLTKDALREPEEDDE